MLQIELAPNLSSCIETVTKNKYWESVNQYLQADERDEQLEERIELLRTFLESANFKELRKESEKHLVSGRDVKFILYSDEGKPRCEMMVEQNKF
jgi:(p)ppGpp synthase/HD superfamily hydrolase